MDRNAILHADTHTTLKHTTSLHSILPIPSEMTPRSLIVTGGEDEDLIVWEDRGEGFAPISRLEAHSHVVSTVRIWQVEGRAGLILSGSLDGTIRRWTLQGGSRVVRCVCIADRRLVTPSSVVIRGGCGRNNHDRGGGTRTIGVDGRGMRRI